MVAVTVKADFPDPPAPPAPETFDPIPTVSPVRGVTLSNDALLSGAAENTVVGTFSHASLTSVTLNDSQGGRFKMVGKVLTVAAVSPDFINYNYPNPVAAPGKERGLAHYEPVVTLNMSAGGNETWTVRIRPRFPRVQTNGGDNASLVLVTDINRDAAAGLTTLFATGSNKRVRFASGLVGSILGGNNIVEVTGNDKTLETPPDGLPPRVSFLRKASYRQNSNRMIYRGLVFATGSEAGGPIDLRDAHQHLSGSDVIYDHCTFLFGCDECLSIKNTTNYTAAGVDAPRRIALLDCAFIHPLYNVGLPENADHDLGLLIGERGHHVDIIRCLWIDVRARCPQLARADGVYQQNNVIGHRAAAFNMNTPDGTTGPNNANFQTYLGVNNLYIKPPGFNNWIVSLYRVGSNSWACFEGARVGTHADMWGVPFDRTNIRTDSNASSHVLTLQGATAASLVDDRPFEPPVYPGYPVLPLTQASHADAIFASVMNNAGARARTLPEGGWLTGDANVPAPVRQFYTEFRAGTRYSMTTIPATFWTGF